MRGSRQDAEAPGPSAESAFTSSVGLGSARPLGAPVRRRGQGGWFVRLLCSVVGCECFVRCGVLCGQHRCKHFPSEWSLVGLDLREAGRGHVTPPWARESHILLPEGHFLSLLMASPHWEMLFFPGVSVLQPGFLEA